MTGSASGGSPLATGTELSLSDFADLALETAADSIFVMDDQGRTVFANAAAERTFGWTRRELVGHKLHDLIHHQYPDGRPFPMAECPLGRVFETRTRLERHEDVFFHRGGEPISVACSNAPLVRDGRMIGAILVAVDITERKRTEEHQRLLLNELTHRVKNTLSLVQAIVRQSIRPGMATADCKAAIDERLIALGRAHDLLIRER